MFYRLSLAYLFTCARKLDAPDICVSVMVLCCVQRQASLRSCCGNSGAGISGCCNRPISGRPSERVTRSFATTDRSALCWIACCVKAGTTSAETYSSVQCMIARIAFQRFWLLSCCGGCSYCVMHLHYLPFDQKGRPRIYVVGLVNLFFVRSSVQSMN